MAGSPLGQARLRNGIPNGFLDQGCVDVMPAPCSLVVGSSATPVAWQYVYSVRKLSWRARRALRKRSRNLGFYGSAGRAVPVRLEGLAGVPGLGHSHSVFSPAAKPGHGDAARYSYLASHWKVNSVPARCSREAIPVRSRNAA